MLAKTFACAVVGLEGRIIEVEVDIASGLPAFGIVGLETAVSLCLDRLVRPGVISLSRMVELLSSGPARILGVPGGTLALGAPADVTLLDLERRVRVDPDTFVSRGRNTPFAGWELVGSATTTIVSGRVVWTRE